MKSTDEELVQKAAFSEDTDEADAAMACWEGRQSDERTQLRKEAAEDLTEVMAAFEKACSETIIKSGDSEQVRDALTWQQHPELMTAYSRARRVLDTQ